MNRNDAIDLARVHALTRGQAGDHAYLPTTDAEAAEWLPHAWVVDAVVSAATAGDQQWLGPYKTAAEALNELRKAVADVIGADPETWPNHGNVPLAIAAAVGMRQAQLNRLRDA